ncbi:MAG TPA: cytochrome c [Candidatus Acidoferrales bacterium]|nr:cytochrome c [Candidatus Acidoferrales bacterium]
MKKLRGGGSTAVVALALALIYGSGGVAFLKAAQEKKPSEAPAGNAENGKKIFLKDGCYECHAREGQGSVMTGPRIAPDPVPFEEFSRYLRKPSGEMPPYTAQVVSDQDLADIYAFLQSRPHPPTAKSNALLK